MVGISEGADPRASRYPNSLVELALMAHVGEEKWRQFLRTRHSKPCPKLWDFIDGIDKNDADRNQQNQTER